MLSYSLIDGCLYSHTCTQTHKTIYINYHLSNAGFPPWHRFWLMNGAGKVQNPNSFGHDLFSFPLITKQLLTDSQHSQHSHNVFLAFQTCRQTGREKRGGEKWEREGKMERKGQWKIVWESGIGLLRRRIGAAGVWWFWGQLFDQKVRNQWTKEEVQVSENEWLRLINDMTSKLPWWKMSLQKMV